MTAFLARREAFDRVGSTNDIVRDWLVSGTPEVCLAIAVEQTSGRGRNGRQWQAPPGTALLMSLGFRPAWLAVAETWRLMAIGAMALADAGEAVHDLPRGTIRSKWPNDLVVETTGTDRDPPGVRKLAGLLGETDGLGTPDPRVVIGLGINTDWPATEFPPDLASSMTSLREIGGGQPVDGAAVLDAFIERLEPAIEALRRDGLFDAPGWSERQVTTGRLLRIERPGGALDAIGAGVDPETGALLVADPTVPDRTLPIQVGEISRVRIVDPLTVGL